MAYLMNGTFHSDVQNQRSFQIYQIYQLLVSVFLVVVHSKMHERDQPLQQLMQIIIANYLQHLAAK
jgi:hypothetical protein